MEGAENGVAVGELVEEQLAVGVVVVVVAVAEVVAATDVVVVGVVDVEVGALVGHNNKIPMQS